MSDASIWEGSAEDIPVVNADGNIFEEVQVATAGKTVFTLTSFEYTPGSNSIFVWKNGVMLRRVTDYTETSSTIVTMLAAAALNDKYTFISIAFNQLLAPLVFNGQPSGGTVGQVLTKQSSSDYDSEWEDPETPVTLLDAARVNIASASTVNLSAIAATTRNIQITGSIQIDGFQVSNGQLWVAKFASSLTLKNNANIVTQAGQDIKVGPNDSCLIRATADNVVEIIAFSKAAAGLVHNYNDFRLSLTTGIPVTTADVTAATTLYCIPYKGNKISLYNGAAWVVRECAEFSLALSGLTVTRPYDVFCYDNVGVPTLEFLAWSTATARATALTTQDGVLVKSGDTTRKYLGSFYALTATTTSDTQRQRLVWNYYNRVKRSMRVSEAAAGWVYNSAVIRQANANVLNQLEVMCGVQEDSVSFSVSASVTNSVAGAAHRVNMGINSITVSGTDVILTEGVPATAGGYSTSLAKLETYAALGFNYYTWLEANTSGAGVSTWTGGTATSGLVGSVFA